MRATKGWAYGLGDKAELEDQYAKFKRCLPQLVDPEGQLGDQAGRWAIFKDGYVYGLSTYKSVEEAHQFSQVMQVQVPWIIVEIDIDGHGLSALEILGACLDDNDAND